MPDSSAAQLHTLRRSLRQRRRSLDPSWRHTADRALVNRIHSYGPYLSARRIALYIAFDGEPDLSPVIRMAQIQGKELYVPHLSGEEMQFVRLAEGARLKRNLFGIAEPAHTSPIAARFLDLVLTPLVAFDHSGTRLGVGGGYYDRCFEFLRTRQAWFRPKLVGIGYSFQCAPSIARQPWDVPLWAAITEQAVHRFPRGSHK